MGGQSAPGGVYNNGLSAMNSGSCDSLNINGGGPSPGRNSSSFRESSVISNGGGSVNSAAAAAASVASLKTYRRSYTHAKPPYSYISLITMAIQVNIFILYFACHAFLLVKAVSLHPFRPTIFTSFCLHHMGFYL
jgi:hypothetical protein